MICAYSERRWDDLQAAVQSVQRQTVAAQEIIVVIDHNPDLLEKAKIALAGATVMPNSQRRGLSGARNTGLQSTTGDVVVFLDDDAVANPSWLRGLLSGYDDPAVLGVGGRIEPRWDGGQPRWFPPEFLWVVGCTYAGMPDTPSPVRNVIGASMSTRRAVASEAGGFRVSLGRIASVPLGGEETEFCIRTAAASVGGFWLYDPRAVVHHRVPTTRANWHYFLTRCLAEGYSKSAVARFVGSGPALASERNYTLRVLPRGILRGLRDVTRGDITGLARGAAIWLGFTATAAGYLVGKVHPYQPSAGPRPHIALGEDEGMTG
ncbi:glycosyltransferase family 2 protein [Deinococcus frigens]|uniref:glycosyltransferase family 2 protein n=1 Tax=Deinococcus frigens TaxID=249403 RepID=UPI003CCBBAE3